MITYIYIYIYIQLVLIIIINYMTDTLNCAEVYMNDNCGEWVESMGVAGGRG